MTAVPVAIEVTTPLPMMSMPGVLTTVATAGFNDVHVTKFVRS